MLSIELSGAQKLVLLVTLPVSGILLYLLLRNSDDEEEGAPPPKVTTTRATVIELKVPQFAVGAIIGSRGANIKQIQDESGARVTMKDGESRTGDTRTVIIRGSSEQAQRAECLVHKVVAEVPRKVEEKIYVPVQAVGRIIGRQGQTIHEMISISKARILVERADSRSKSDTRLVTLTGTPEAIANAKALIEEKIQEEDVQRAKLALSAANRPRRQVTTHRVTAAGAGAGQPQPPAPSYQEAGDCSSATGGQSQTIPGTRDVQPSNGNASEERDSQLKPANWPVRFKTYTDVYVSSVATPYNFWVQLVCSESVQLDRLNESLTRYCAVQPKNHHASWKVGDLVAAPYEQDNNWYRAKVMEVLEEQVDLYFLDYGDSMYLDSTLLVPLSSQFTELEPQAHECRLEGVEPIDGNSWSEDTVEIFEDITHAAKWKVLVAQTVRVDDSIRVVKLVDTNGSQDIDIAADLVARGVARWKRPLADAASTDTWHAGASEANLARACDETLIFAIRPSEVDPLSAHESDCQIPVKMNNSEESCVDNGHASSVKANISGVRQEPTTEKSFFGSLFRLGNLLDFLSHVSQEKETLKKEASVSEVHSKGGGEENIENSTECDTNYLKNSKGILSIEENPAVNKSSQVLNVNPLGKEKITEVKKNIHVEAEKVTLHVSPRSESCTVNKDVNGVGGEGLNASDKQTVESFSIHCEERPKDVAFENVPRNATDPPVDITSNKNARRKKVGIAVAIRQLSIEKESKEKIKQNVAIENEEKQGGVQAATQAIRDISGPTETFELKQCTGSQVQTIAENESMQTNYQFPLITNETTVDTNDVNKTRIDCSKPESIETGSPAGSLELSVSFIQSDELNKQISKCSAEGETCHCGNVEFSNKFPLNRNSSVSDIQEDNCESLNAEIACLEDLNSSARRVFTGIEKSRCENVNTICDLVTEGFNSNIGNRLSYVNENEKLECRNGNDIKEEKGIELDSNANKDSFGFTSEVGYSLSVCPDKQEKVTSISPCVQGATSGAHSECASACGTLTEDNNSYSNGTDSNGKKHTATGETLNDTRSVRANSKSVFDKNGTSGVNIQNETKGLSDQNCYYLDEENVSFLLNQSDTGHVRSSTDNDTSKIQEECVNQIYDPITDIRDEIRIEHNSDFKVITVEISERKIDVSDSCLKGDHSESLGSCSDHYDTCSSNTSGPVFSCGEHDIHFSDCNIGDADCAIFEDHCHLNSQGSTDFTEPTVEVGTFLYCDSEINQKLQSSGDFSWQILLNKVNMPGNQGKLSVSASLLESSNSIHLAQSLNSVMDSGSVVGSLTVQNGCEPGSEPYSKSQQGDSCEIAPDKDRSKNGSSGNSDVVNKHQDMGSSTMMSSVEDSSNGDSGIQEGSRSDAKCQPSSAPGTTSDDRDETSSLFSSDSLDLSSRDDPPGSTDLAQPDASCSDAHGQIQTSAEWRHRALSPPRSLVFIEQGFQPFVQAKEVQLHIGTDRLENVNSENDNHCSSAYFQLVPKEQDSSPIGKLFQDKSSCPQRSPIAVKLDNPHVDTELSVKSTPEKYVILEHLETLNLQPDQSIQLQTTQECDAQTEMSTIRQRNSAVTGAPAAASLVSRSFKGQHDDDLTSRVENDDITEGDDKHFTCEMHIDSCQIEAESSDMADASIQELDHDSLYSDDSLCEGDLSDTESLPDLPENGSPHMLEIGVLDPVGESVNDNGMPYSSCHPRSHKKSPCLDFPAVSESRCKSCMDDVTASPEITPVSRGGKEEGASRESLGCVRDADLHRQSEAERAREASEQPANTRADPQGAMERDKLRDLFQLSSLEMRVEHSDVLSRDQEMVDESRVKSACCGTQIPPVVPQGYFEELFRGSGDCDTMGQPIGSTSQESECTYMHDSLEEEHLLKLCDDVIKTLPVKKIELSTDSQTVTSENNCANAGHLMFSESDNAEDFGAEESVCSADKSSRLEDSLEELSESLDENDEAQALIMTAYFQNNCNPVSRINAAGDKQFSFADLDVGSLDEMRQHPELECYRHKGSESESQPTMRNTTRSINKDVAGKCELESDQMASNPHCVGYTCNNETPEQELNDNFSSDDSRDDSVFERSCDNIENLSLIRGQDTSIQVSETLEDSIEEGRLQTLLEESLPFMDEALNPVDESSIRRCSTPVQNNINNNNNKSDAKVIPPTLKSALRKNRKHKTACVDRHSRGERRVRFRDPEISEEFERSESESDSDEESMGEVCYDLVNNMYLYAVPSGRAILADFDEDVTEF